MTSAFRALAAPFLSEGVLTHAEVAAVDLVAPRFGETDPVRLLGLAMAVRAPREGHAGVDLCAAEARVEAERLLFAAGEAPNPLPWPDAASWMAETARSPLVGGPADRLRPFVLQETSRGPLLHTRRMYREQERLAAAIHARASSATVQVPGGIDAVLARLFAGDLEGEAPRAVRLAARSHLAIIVGGPGTGKTFSISRLLAALVETWPPGSPLKIALAAPTGKAAARMREAIREATDPRAKPPLDVGEDVRARLQNLDASTLHRLLRMRPSGEPGRDALRPIDADIVVVDEASMVDLALMRRLVEAVREGARLVLLGDRDQLASVEAGCVLADLVGEGEGGPLFANVSKFSRSHRFESAPDVALVAACLQTHAVTHPDAPPREEARSERAAEVLLGRAHATAELHKGARVRWLGPPLLETPHGGLALTEAQLDELVAPYVAGFERFTAEGALRIEGYASAVSAYLKAARSEGGGAETDPRRALLEVLDAYRVLVVHRRGPLGVARIEEALARRVHRVLHPGKRYEAGALWPGRPILIRENAPDVGLFNGDVGIVLPGETGLAAAFPREEAGAVRMVVASRLPRYEGALAMTVHKSQGSQFERVALVLAGRPSVLQTRELVYTGITRARNQLAWFGTEEELRDALGRRVSRASGLGELLGPHAADR